MPTLELKARFGTDDKERHCLLETIQTPEIHIAAVHDDIRTGLGDNLIEGFDVADLGVSDIDEHWNGALDIDHRVKFYTALGSAELGPGKQGQAQIDRRRIQCVECTLELQAQIRFGIQRPSNLDEALCEIEVDSPVPTLVGIGESGAFYQGMKTRMVEFSSVRRQAHFDIAETLSMG